MSESLLPQSVRDKAIEAGVHARSISSDPTGWITDCVNAALDAVEREMTEIETRTYAAGDTGLYYADAPFDSGGYYHGPLFGWKKDDE